MNREPRYYWVKFAGEWQPAQFHGTPLHWGRDWWSIFGPENFYCSEDFEKIGERIIHK